MGALFWDVRAVGGFVRLIRLLELGDWRHDKADVLLYCIVTNQ